ncbi:hypothetical protein CD798_08445 [Bacillaceae bacterium SAOS 7]|nr:hypothetical protein CD798_08445 [Bacillaceae bacterium SAOS 7]
MKISVKGPIISNSDQWIYDWFGIEATSPKKINDQLSEAGKEDLEVEINSGGGSVFDASEIYAVLKDHPANVTVKILGLAASAASVIAMAGNKIMMAPTAQMMIHNASARTQGDYRDMKHAAGFLKNVNQTIANAYSIKSGKGYEELLAMMDKETWLTPQQALEHNLIDEVMFEGQGVTIVASADDGMIPQKVIDRIRNELGLSNTVNPSKQVNSEPVVVTNQKEDGSKMTLEELKNQHPELFEQVKNQGYEAGVQAENDRIKNIEDLAIPGQEELVNQAKFENKITAEQLAVEIVKAEKNRGSQFLQNRNSDAEPLNSVPGAVAPENNGKSDDAEAAEKGKGLADLINKMRGGN